MKKADIKPLPKRSRTPQKLCAALADLFEEHPELWGQGTWVPGKMGGSPPDDCLCVLTGIDALSGGGVGVTTHGLMAGAHFALVNKITADVTDVIAPVAVFNDATGRTVKEIVAGLRKAASATPQKKVLARVLE